MSFDKKEFEFLFDYLSFDVFSRKRRKIESEMNKYLLIFRENFRFEYSKLKDFLRENDRKFSRSIIALNCIVSVFCLDSNGLTYFLKVKSSKKIYWKKKQMVFFQVLKDLYVVNNYLDSNI